MENRRFNNYHTSVGNKANPPTQLLGKRTANLFTLFLWSSGRNGDNPVEVKEKCWKYPQKSSK
jgi:hypothetical protein